jgi:hypothetical protein
MKPLFVICLLLSFVLQVAAQNNTPLTKEEYLKKSKSQLITGIVLLGAGTVVTGIGINQMVTYTGNDIGNAIGGAFGLEPTKQGSNGVALTVVGIATVTASGFLLLAAKRNKNAARVAVNMELKQSGLVYSRSVRNINYPAVSVRVRLQ